MEKRRKRSSSPAENQDSDFEFGFFTPDSPSQDPNRTSPADHLFFNGRLLPHSFPLQPSKMVAAEHMVTNCRGTTTSRTNSINSKDSLMYSRSNSNNSRSSCSSSARTSSSSDSSERRLLYHSNKIHASCYNSKASKLVNGQLYGDTVQRWQYITPVPPVMKRGNISRKKNSGVVVKEDLRAKKKSDDHHHQERSSIRRKSGPCLGFFRLFLLLCRQCHAIEPSRKQDVRGAKNMSSLGK